MYVLASILFIFCVYALVCDTIVLAVGLVREKGPVHPWLFGLYSAYIAAYLTFIN